LEVPFDPAQIDAELLSVRGKYNKQSAKAEIDPSSVGEPRDGSEGRGEWEV
jgi:hypothetical protein